MTNILLIDTNFSSAPIYDYLVKSDYQVFVCGNNPNDFLAKVSPNYIQIDYSNIVQTRSLINSLNIDYIVPGCNDLSYKVCSQLNDRGQFYGIDQYEITEIINNKKQFRLFAEKNGLPVPRIISVDQLDSDSFPLIVKPTDAYSGRGTTVIDKSNSTQLETAIALAKSFSRSNSYIIEQYVQGQLFSHSAFICNGRIIQDFIVEEHGTANPFVVDTSRVIYDFASDLIRRIRETIMLMADKLNLVDGLIHTQFIKQGDLFWLIEVTRRCPGDLYSQLIELSTGFSYAEAYTKPFLNQTVSAVERKLKQSYIMRHTISQPTEQFFSSIQFNVPIHIEKLVNLSLAGDLVKSSPFGRIGLLFAKAESKEELNNLFKITLKRQLYIIN